MSSSSAPVMPRASVTNSACPSVLGSSASKAAGDLVAHGEVGDTRQSDAALGECHRLFLAREAHGLAADRIVLAQRVPVPVVFHDQTPHVRVSVEGDAHQVVLLALVPVGGRPDGDDARNLVAVFDPALQAPPHGRLAMLGLALSAQRLDEHFDPRSDHLRFYTRRTLGRLLADFGFEQIEVRSAGGIPGARRLLLAAAVRARF